MLEIRPREEKRPLLGPVAGLPALRREPSQRVVGVVSPGDVEDESRPRLEPRPRGRRGVVGERGELALRDRVLAERRTCVAQRDSGELVEIGRHGAAFGFEPVDRGAAHRGSIRRRREQFGGGRQRQPTQEGDPAAFLLKSTQDERLASGDRPARRERPVEPFDRDIVRLDRLGRVRLGKRHPAIDERSLPRRGDAEAHGEIGAFRGQDPEQDLLDLIGEATAAKRMTFAGGFDQRVAERDRGGGCCGDRRRIASGGDEREPRRGEATAKRFDRIGRRLRAAERLERGAEALRSEAFDEPVVVEPRPHVVAGRGGRRRPLRRGDRAGGERDRRDGSGGAGGGHRADSAKPTRP